MATVLATHFERRWNFLNHREQFAHELVKCPSNFMQQGQARDDLPTRWGRLYLNRKTDRRDVLSERVHQRSAAGRQNGKRRGQMSENVTEVAKGKKGPQVPTCDFVTILLLANYFAKVSS
jgi:hypothetical protein